MSLDLILSLLVIDLPQNIVSEHLVRPIDLSELLSCIFVAYVSNHWSEMWDTTTRASGPLTYLGSYLDGTPVTSS